MRPSFGRDLPHLTESIFKHVRGIPPVHHFNKSIGISGGDIKGTELVISKGL